MSYRCMSPDCRSLVAARIETGLVSEFLRLMELSFLILFLNLFILLFIKMSFLSELNTFSWFIHPP